MGNIGSGGVFFLSFSFFYNLGFFFSTKSCTSSVCIFKKIIRAWCVYQACNGGGSVAVTSDSRHQSRHLLQSSVITASRFKHMPIEAMPTSRYLPLAYLQCLPWPCLTHKLHVSSSFVVHRKASCQPSTLSKANTKIIKKPNHLHVFHCCLHY